MRLLHTLGFHPLKAHYIGHMKPLVALEHLEALLSVIPL